MSGMLYPNTVQVRYRERDFQGCGGDPATLLQGTEWVLEDMAGRGLIDRSRITLVFGVDGQLSGRASCNSYVASYALTGETLQVSQAVTTRMACAPTLGQQETLFLALLQEVQRFTFSADGALLLDTADGRQLLARRAKAL